MRRLFLALCAFLFLAVNAEASGRLAMRGQVPASGGPVLNQTAYWGPKTLNQNGGYDPCQSLCTLPIISSPSTTNFFYDSATGWIVPKNGATTTYNGVRSTPLSGTEDFVLTDSASHVITVHNVADQSRAGDYTIRWVDGKLQNSTCGTATNCTQLLAVFPKLNYGETVRVRGGTTWNTTLNCNPTTNCTTGGGTLANGTTIYSFVCGTGNCTSGGTGFTGSNYKQILPELGTTVMFGPISFGSQSGAFTQLVGVRFADFLVDGEAPSYTGYMIDCAPGSGGTGGVGAGQFLIENITIVGNLADPFGITRPSGIKTCADSNWTIKNVNASYLGNGMNLAQSSGTYPTDVGGTAPAGGYDVENNVFSQIGIDVLDVSCIRNTIIKNNLFTDKVTKVKVGSLTSSPVWINPFDSTNQFHGDFTQFNGRQGGAQNACIYQNYPGVVIEGNVIVRGIGRDSLPFWVHTTGPPVDFPDPNLTGSVNSGAMPQSHPDPTAGQGSGQGLAWTNQYGNNGDFYNGSGGVLRTYALNLQGVIIRNNIVMQEFANGLNPAAMENATIVGNVILNPKPPAANLYDSTWGFGLAKALVAQDGVACAPGPCPGSMGGTNIVDRNIGGSGSLWTHSGAVFTGQNTTVTIANYPTMFQNPNAHGSPRDINEYKAGWLPILHGPAVVCTVLGVEVYAGPFRPDGTAETGSCP